MPALRKPHRVAFLVPELTVDGGDAASAREADLLLWIACIEVCQRHPGLAVYEAEATPLVSHDGHFVPLNAQPGATPADPFYQPTRRDELAWLELALPTGGAVRLHTLSRDGVRETFEAAAATGRSAGDRIHQAIERWLAARGLGALPRRFDAADGGELLAQVRTIAPVLSEHARAYVRIEQQAWAAVDPGAAERSTVAGGDSEHSTATGGGAVATGPRRLAGNRMAARNLAARLPPALKVPALRLLQLALHEDLGDLILADDPDQPQALFERFRSSAAHGRDFALLRRIIAIAPGWAAPYGELIGGTRSGGDGPEHAPPSELETVAGAGLAALCRPEQLDVIQTCADRLDGHGRIDEGVRLLERAVAHDPAVAAAHIALVERLRRADRPGAWLLQAQRSQTQHGCPLDPALPCYPDQIQVDLLMSDALLRTGRLDEAIALRALRLQGREASWPRHARILTSWRKDPRLVARCYAREAAVRGDPARVVEGLSRAAPEDAVELAALLDALVATGREAEVVLAWAELGLGKQLAEPVARLAAARGLLAAGQWRRGVEELWRVELTQPGRDDHTQIARCGRLLASAPLDVLEAALGERVVIGAPTLARRMARAIADFVPGAHRSSIIARALGKLTPIELDPAWFAGFAADTASRHAIDTAFADSAGPGTAPGDPADAQVRADRLVDRWIEAVFVEASDDDPRALAQAAAYTAAHALVRYLVATTQPPSPLAGGYRTVAAEALALVRHHRSALSDRDALGVLGALDPVLRRVDRWVGNAWLGTVERSCAIDERTGGDVTGFAAGHAIVAARILGPEDTAVLSASIARLARDRPDGWASAVIAQAGRLIAHTGCAGVVELADAVVAQLDARELEPDDAIDLLHTACYVAEGMSAVPCVHAARVLFAAGRGPAAFAVLCAGLPAAEPAWRAAQLAQLADAWSHAQIDVPLALAPLVAQLAAAVSSGEPARAEKLGRFAVAIDPRNSSAHRDLGIALAQQAKVPEALHHLARGAPALATQLLASVLAEADRLPEAMAVLDYASRGYVRAEPWLTLGGVAYAAMDSPRAAAAYALAYRLDPGAFDHGQLSAYAGVLDEIGDHATCEAIANHLLRAAGDDVTWKTHAWAHLSCAYGGQGKRDEAVSFARWAVDHNPVPDNAAGFAAILERATSPQSAPIPVAVPPRKPREPVFDQLDAGDLRAAATAVLAGAPSWRVRRAQLTAARHRSRDDNHIGVTPRARTAAAAVLAATAGLVDLGAASARELALAIREHAYFARDPVPPLGIHLTPEAFRRAFRARGGVVLGEDAPPPPALVDRVVVAGGRIERISDYVALLRDLAALPPHEALAQFDLDEASYLEVATAWAAAIAADPVLALAIAAGLARP